MSENKLISYWEWFFNGSGNKPGIKNIFNIFIVFHFYIGLFLALIITSKIEDCASSIIVPTMSILVGLSFAWAGNAQGLLQTEEIKELAKYSKGGYVEYIFIYQTAILVILTSIILWGLGGLHLFDIFWPTSKNPKIYYLIKAFLFSILSLSVRECWHVVLGVSWMLQAKKKIEENKKK